MEPISALLITLGVAILAVSWILLLITSAKEDFTWALCTVFLPPLSYLYGLFRLDLAKDTLILAVVGWLLIALALL